MYPDQYPLRNRLTISYNLANSIAIRIANGKVSGITNYIAISIPNGIPDCIVNDIANAIANVIAIVTGVAKQHSSQQDHLERTIHNFTVINLGTLAMNHAQYMLCAIIAKAH